MKSLMIGGLAALFATGCFVAYSASAQSPMPLAGHHAGAAILIGWGDNGQGGGYGGTPQNQGGGYGGGQQNQGGGWQGGGQPQNQGGTYNNNGGNANQGGQSGYGGNNQGGNTQGSGQQGSGQSGQSSSNGNSSGSSSSSGGSKSAQAVCLGHCHDDCQRDAIANHLFKIPQACLKSCNQRCQ
jgi:hypothetical protein